MLSLNRVVCIFVFIFCFFMQNAFVMNVESSDPSGQYVSDVKTKQVKKRRKKSNNNKMIVAGGGVLAVAGLLGLGAVMLQPPKTNLIPAQQRITPEFKEDRQVQDSQSFRFYNLKRLQEDVDGKGNPNPAPAFNIIFMDSTMQADERIKQFVDVSEIMKQPQNQGSVFQFASNDDPTWTKDEAGGQARVILEATDSAAQFRKQHSNVKSLGTTGSSPANIDNILIGLHQNVCVRDQSSLHKIHLSIVAARQKSGNLQHSDNCLKAAYDGTLLSAASLIGPRGAPKVFLTMMGAGIFAAANPMQNIVNAIESTVNTYVPKFGLNVTLIYWQKDKEPGILDQEQRLFDLARQFKGFICKFDENPSYEKDGKSTALNMPADAVNALLFGSPQI